MAGPAQFYTVITHCATQYLLKQKEFAFQVGLTGPELAVSYLKTDMKK